MNISDYLKPNQVHHDFRARNKEQALTRMAAILTKVPELAAIPEEQIRQLLADREAVVSTGIGNGVAIPHARIDGLKDFIVVLLAAPDGVEFDALDRKRVHLFFIVMAPSDKVSEHLKLLAGLARVLNQPAYRKEALKARTSEVLYEITGRYLGGDMLPGKADQRKRRLLILVLYYDQLLNDVLEYLIDMEVDGATIIRSEGMGAHISSLPLFASFMSFMREDMKISHTILALIPEETEAEIIRGIETITGDLDTTQGAMLMTLDVGFFKGSMKMI